MPIVIDNPEIEARLSAFATARGLDLASAIGRAIDAAEEEGALDDAALTPADLESIGRGLAQADAGELLDGDAVMEELFGAVGLPDAPLFNAGNPRRRWGAA